MQHRDGENLEAVGVAGFYPCGEGAGYAGGHHERRGGRPSLRGKDA